MSEQEVAALLKRAEDACRPCGPCDSGLPMGCNCDPEPRAVIAGLLALVAQARRDAEQVHRDLTRRLGFGDNITEPMADNGTIVAWVEGLDSGASEWRESQRWRDECALAGHPQDVDCLLCDPIEKARRDAAEEALREAADASDVAFWPSWACPEDVTDWLRGRADVIARAGETTA